MEPARETAKERGGVPVSVRNVLLGSVAGGVTLWGRDLGFSRGNLQESGRGACGFPQTVYGSVGHAKEGRYLDMHGIGEGT